MKKLQTQVMKVTLLFLLASSILCLMNVATAQTDSAAGIDLPQQYSATAIGQAGAIAGKTFGVNVYLTGLTSDEQRQELVATLKSKGQDGVVSAMEKLPDLGRVSPVGSVGSGFRYVRAHKTPDGGLQITMATNRPISFGELYNFTRSSQYPIGIVTLSVDKDGNGTGLLYGACKVKFNKKGELEMEHYGQKPWRLANIRRQK